MTEILWEALVKDAAGMTRHIRVDSEDDGGLTFFVDGTKETHFSGTDMDTLVAGGTVMVAGHPFSMPPELRESWKQLQVMRKLLDTLDSLLGQVNTAREQLRKERELAELLHHPAARA